jgi:hypothetical protein
MLKLYSRCKITVSFTYVTERGEGKAGRASREQDGKYTKRKTCFPVLILVNGGILIQRLLHHNAFREPKEQ